MQVFPDSWDDKLKDLFGDALVEHSENSENEKGKVELNGRVNFKFNRDAYFVFKQNRPKHNYKIVRTDKEDFNNMKGSVVPMYYWKDAEHFLNHGVGFSLFYDNQLASTAYSAYVHDNYLELGIETVEEYRGKGLAQYACSALIDYCLHNNLEPVWSCRFENTNSCKLAQKLGFEPVSKRSYYKLPY
jgi:GNAT superfamily N-acetyltransferase